MSSQPATLRFLGCGDAFGTGGRLQTSFWVEMAGLTFLVDCGSTVFPALRQHELDPTRIDAVLISHLHGDHFGGLPFLILEAQFISERTRPLTIVAPPPAQERIDELREAMFPTSTAVETDFDCKIIELPENTPTDVSELRVTGYLVSHSRGINAYGLRIEAGGKVLAFSGDTEWTPNLVELSRGADLFVCECYGYDKPTHAHLDYRTLLAHRDELDCKRMILTHMGPDMLNALDDLEVETAHDGLELQF